MLPIDLPWRAQAALVAEGALSLAELHQLTRARIAQRDPQVCAFVHLAEAAQPHAPDPDRPLAGLPFAVKDLIDVAGQPTRCGSYAHPIKPVERDAACVAPLRAAGLVPLGKLATYEYALTGPAWDQPNPPARNPWDTGHITGGSSSGSAAAVAAGLVRVALGTDTGGSVRSPAAYSGVVGLKPTHGMVSDWGVFPLAPSLDVVGPLAATVAEAALALDLMTGRPPTAEARIGQDITGLRIGYARDWFADDPACAPAVLRAMDDAAGTLSRLGARIELVHLPDYAPIETAGMILMQAEAWQAHQSGLAARYDAYGQDARRNLLIGAGLEAEEVAQAKRFATALRQRIDQSLAPFAALLAPTTLSRAPAFDDFKEGAVWTAMRTLPFNMTGHPALSIPCGFDEGLPLGLQLIGRPYDEATLCQIGHAFEQATDATARPAMAEAPVSLEV